MRSKHNIVNKIYCNILQIKSVIINIFGIPVSDNSLEGQGLPCISKEGYHVYLETRSTEKCLFHLTRVMIHVDKEINLHTCPQLLYISGQ